MSAALPKAPKVRHKVKPWSPLEVPPSNSGATSRSRQFPSEIRASSRSHHFYEEEEGPGICYPASCHVIGCSWAPAANSKSTRPAGKAAGNSAVGVLRLHSQCVAGGVCQGLFAQKVPAQCRGLPEGES